MKQFILSLSILFFASMATACDCQLNLSNVFFGTFSGQVEINGQTVTGGAITLAPGPVTVNYYNGAIGNAIGIVCDEISVYTSGVLVTTEDQTPLAVFNLAENCSNCPEFELPCDDMNDCTVDDKYNLSCQCEGTFQDSDADGVCDADDVCAGSDDSIDSNENEIPDCLEAALPVDFHYIEADIHENQVRISWKVTQKNTSHYIVFRLFGDTWEQNAIEDATNSIDEVYTVLLSAPAGDNIYKVYGIDYDGTVSPSKIIQVTKEPVLNPDQLELRLNSGVHGRKEKRT